MMTMASCKLKYLDFVPGKNVKHCPAENAIYIFSHKFGKKIYKKKTQAIGFIIEGMGHEYCLACPPWNVFYSNETIELILVFLNWLNERRIKFDPIKKGLYEPKKIRRRIKR